MTDELDIAGIDTLVLGIGNILWADEGFGVRVVEEIHRRYAFPDNVLLMDGGTQGLYLVQYVKEAKRLLVFDAIDWGDPAGTMRVILDEEVPKFMGCRKMSLHQTGFQDVLAAASLLGGGPSDLALVGVQAEELDDWGGSLRPSIKACIEPAIAHGLDILKGWGIHPVKRPEPLPETEGLLRHNLDMSGYEVRRPIPGLDA